MTIRARLSRVLPKRWLYPRVAGVEWITCPSCSGEGEGLDWWGGSLERCGQCRGRGEIPIHWRT